jgi:hypothetical protein
MRLTTTASSMTVLATDPADCRRAPRRGGGPHRRGF